MPSDDWIALPEPDLCKAPAQYDDELEPLEGDYQRMAREYLRETEILREQSLAQLRDWIVKHPQIKRCRTDARFLLRFLRTKKYSFINASKMLERYLACRVVHPQWFTCLDIEDPGLGGLVKAGYMYPLLELDAKGRTVILSDSGALDPKIHNASHACRMHMIVGESLYDEATVQCAGFVLIYDMSQLPMSMLSTLSLNDIRDLANYLNNAIPMRIQEMHYVNTPGLAAKLANFAIGLMNEKLRNRIICHRTWDDLYKRVDKHLLPQEYGGKVPKDEHIGTFVRRCHIYRKRLLSLDHMDFEIDRNSDYWKQSSANEIESGVIGSFRRLEVD